MNDPSAISQILGLALVAASTYGLERAHHFYTAWRKK